MNPWVLSNLGSPTETCQDNVVDTNDNNWTTMVEEDGDQDKHLGTRARKVKVKKGEREEKLLFPVKEI